MSEQNETQGNESERKVFTREDGTQYEQVAFSLKSTKEIADRFRGDHTILISLPVEVKGDTEATLRNLRAFVHPEADLSEVLVAKFVGQGLRLDAQKAVKEFLAPFSGTGEDTRTIEVDGQQVRVADASVQSMLDAAQAIASTFRLGSPRQRSVTGGAKAKLEQAKATAKQAVNTAVSMYRQLSPAMREQFRDQLLATGQVTAEELQAVEEESAPAKGGKR